MTLFEKTITAFTNKDFATLKDIHHEDFMFVREFSLATSDEHLADLKEFMRDTKWHLLVKCIHEDDYVLVMRTSEIDEDGSEIVSNNVSLKKDGLYWRTFVKNDKVQVLETNDDQKSGQ